MKEQSFTLNYNAIRLQLALFLRTVGAQVLELRARAEASPDFFELKEDGTLVTRADFLAEKLIRNWIAERFPAHTIRGEELTDKCGNEYMWVIDPIDGTHPFKHFGRGFGISVGLVKNNSPKVGVIYYPAENKILSAAEGSGARIGSQPLKVKKREVKNALLIAELPDNLDDPRFSATGKKLTQLLKRVRSEKFETKCFTFGFLRLVEKDRDAIFHFGATPYDIAAVCSIAKESGMTFSGFKGEPPDFSKNIIPIVVSKNAEFHRMIIQWLNE